MRLRGQLASGLGKVVDVIAKVDGVVGVILFGSLARGDYDEHSDYDLLVIFEDKPSMWRSWNALFQAVSGFEMILHIIPETLDELERANPVFLDDLSKYGKVLYARPPLEVFSKPFNLKPFSLILYDMSGLRSRDKMRVVYLLYRKGGGVVAGMGGMKLRDGCVLVPSGVGDELIEMLRGHGVSVKRLEVYLNQEE